MIWLGILLGFALGASGGLTIFFMERTRGRFEADRWALERARILEEAGKERRELAARIQAWSPEPAEEVPAWASQDAKREPQVYTSGELAKLDIRPNSDGCYVDLKTGELFETPEDIQEWRAHLRKAGLPLNVSPGITAEFGAEAALAAATEKKEV